jgi:hypothetical protein
MGTADAAQSPFGLAIAAFAQAKVINLKKHLHNQD